MSHNNDPWASDSHTDADEPELDELFETTDTSDLEEFDDADSDTESDSEPTTNVAPGEPETDSAPDADTDTTDGTGDSTPPESDDTATPDSFTDPSTDDSPDDTSDDTDDAADLNSLFTQETAPDASVADPTEETPDDPHATSTSPEASPEDDASSSSQSTPTQTDAPSDESTTKLVTSGANVSVPAPDSDSVDDSTTDQSFRNLLPELYGVLIPTDEDTDSDSDTTGWESVFPADTIVRLKHAFTRLFRTFLSIPVAVLKFTIGFCIPIVPWAMALGFGGLLVELWFNTPGDELSGSTSFWLNVFLLIGLAGSIFLGFYVNEKVDEHLEQYETT